MATRAQSRRIAVAERLGYDPDVLMRLRREQRRALDSLSQAWLFSCVVLAIPVAYAAYLIEHSLFFAALGAAFTFVMVKNLLRLVCAGGGVALHESRNEGYRPPFLPALILGVLALVLAQPAQLILSGSEVEAQLAVHRQELLAGHQRSAENLPFAAESSQAYAARLQQCDFILLRLKLLASQPERTLMWSFIYCMVVLFPWLLAQAPFLGAVQAYERERYANVEARVHANQLRAHEAIDCELRRYATYDHRADKKAILPLYRGYKENRQ
jgi:hypothetical protein